MATRLNSKVKNSGGQGISAEELVKNANVIKGDLQISGDCSDEFLEIVGYDRLVKMHGVEVFSSCVDDDSVKFGDLVPNLPTLIDMRAWEDLVKIGIGLKFDCAKLLKDIENDRFRDVRFKIKAELNANRLVFLSGARVFTKSEALPRVLLARVYKGKLTERNIQAKFVLGDAVGFDFFALNHLEAEEPDSSYCLGCKAHPRIKVGKSQEVPAAVSAYLAELDDMLNDYIITDPLKLKDIRNIILSDVGFFFPARGRSSTVRVLATLANQVMHRCKH